MTTINKEQLKAWIEELESDQDSFEALPDLTETGNGYLLAQQTMGQIIYVPEISNWYYWNGTRWQEDTDGYVVRLYLKTVIPELTNILRDTDDKESKNVMSWIRRSKQMSTLKNSLTAASHVEGMTKSLQSFDTKGHYFGVKNGVLDLRQNSFRLIQEDSAFLMTKSANVDYVPEADCPEWKAFIQKITKGDSELAGFLKRIAGQAMLGRLGKDKLPIFYGSGSNGKSTFVDVLNDLFGEYASATSSSVVMSDRSSTEYYLAPLKGLRLLLLNETKKGQKMAEEIVKMMVDSGEITARYPKGRVFSFQPLFTPILSTNHKPRISGADFGIWRRIYLVPFTYRFKDEEKIAGFREKVLRPEMPGILNWCIEGCMAYQKRGLDAPESVMFATDEYRRQQDKIGSFISERYREQTDGRIRLKQVHTQFSKWCEENKLPAQGIIEFRNDLVDRGYEIRVSTGSVAWLYGLADKQKGESDKVVLELLQACE
ncbi:MAG: hypothetical protein G8D91_09155 [gamma proteobacterium symbiont of Clathrolucina costata]